jgi:hypothetical protein
MNSFFQAIERDNVDNVNKLCLDVNDYAKRLPLDSNSVISFYEFGIQLFDRAFGEDTTDRPDADLPNTWVQIRKGGWLRKLLSQPSYGYNDPSTFQRPAYFRAGTRELIDILSYNSNFMEVLKKPRQNYEMKIDCFPKKYQMLISKHLHHRYVQTESQHVYFSHFQYLANDAAQGGKSFSIALLTPFEYFLLCIMRYPTMDEQMFAPITSAYASYYTQQQQQQSTKKAFSIHENLQSIPYFALLDNYMKTLLPHTQTNQMSPASESFLRDDELFLQLAVAHWMDSALIVRRDHGDFLASLRNASFAAAAGYSPRGGADPVYDTDHYHPTEVLLANNTAPLWTSATMQCITLLVAHVCSNPSLSKQYMEQSQKNMNLLAADMLFGYGAPGSSRVNNQLAKYYSQLRRVLCSDGELRSQGLTQVPLSYMSGRATAHAVPGLSNPVSLVPCPASVHPIQQPLFDMLRLIFTKGELSVYSKEVFHQAVDIWLLYVQPWKAADAFKHRYQHADDMSRGVLADYVGSFTTPFASDGSRKEPLGQRYSHEWDVYIASNLHFYTTLLVCFLRSLSVARLGATDIDGPSFFLSLEKVLKVFSGELLSTICTLSSEFRGWYMQHTRVQRYDSSEYAALEGYARKPFAQCEKNQRVCVTSAMLLAMTAQHQYLFPDSKVDLLLDAGLVDTRMCVLTSLVTTMKSLVKLEKATTIGLVMRIYYALVEQVNNTRATVYSEARVKHVVNYVNAIVEDLEVGLGAEHRIGFERGLLLVSDSLDDEIRPYEWSALTYFNIKLSKYLNRVFDLPKNREGVSWSVEKILSEAWKNSASKSPLMAVCECFRFNFRLLSSYTVVVAMSFAFIIFVLYFQLVTDFWQLLRLIFGLSFSWWCLLSFEALSKEEEYSQDPSKVFDELSAKLTPVGKARMTAGLARSDHKLLRYAGDPLDKPFNSYEWEPATLLMIRLSKHLNSRFNLPLNKASATWTHEQMFVQSWRRLHESNPVIALVRCFRFNLRCLSRVRVMSCFLMVISGLAYYIGLLGEIMLAACLATAIIGVYFGRAPANLI